MPFFDSDEARYVSYRPGDLVLYREQEYAILSIYRNNNTDVTLVATSGYGEPGEMVPPTHPRRLVRARLKDLRHAL